MTTAATPRLALSVRDASEAVGVSIVTIRHAINTGQLVAKFVRGEDDLGDRIVVRVADLEVWLEGLDHA